MKSLITLALLAALAVMVSCLVSPSLALASNFDLPNDSAVGTVVVQRGGAVLDPPPAAGHSTRVARGLGKRLRKIGKKIDHGVRHVKIGEIGFGMPKGKGN